MKSKRPHNIHVSEKSNRFSGNQCIWNLLRVSVILRDPWFITEWSLCSFPTETNVYSFELAIDFKTLITISINSTDYEMQIAPALKLFIEPSLVIYFILLFHIFRIILMEDAIDCLMSFPDFLYAFQTQFFYEGKEDFS